MGATRLTQFAVVEKEVACMVHTRIIFFGLDQVVLVV